MQKIGWRAQKWLISIATLSYLMFMYASRLPFWSGILFFGYFHLNKKYAETIKYIWFWKWLEYKWKIANTWTSKTIYKFSFSMPNWNCCRHCENHSPFFIQMWNRNENNSAAIELQRNCNIKSSYFSIERHAWTRVLNTFHWKWHSRLRIKRLFCKWVWRRWARHTALSHYTQSIIIFNYAWNQFMHSSMSTLFFFYSFLAVISIEL